MASRLEADQRKFGQAGRQRWGTVSIDLHLPPGAFGKHVQFDRPDGTFDVRMDPDSIGIAFDENGALWGAKTVAVT